MLKKLTMEEKKDFMLNIKRADEVEKELLNYDSLENFIKLTKKNLEEIERKIENLNNRSREKIDIEETIKVFRYQLDYIKTKGLKTALEIFEIYVMTYCIKEMRKNLKLL